MKKLPLLALAIVLTTLISGCGKFQNELKHRESDWIGLHRRITLYEGGQVIRTWETRTKVEDHGGTCSFIANGKVVIVAGTFVIEEI